MSLRRALWGSQFSYIQLENCLLQMRKVCEGYAQLNLLVSHIEFEDLPGKLISFYQVDKIIKGLRKLDKKHPLSRGRMELVEPDATPRRWHLHVDPITQEDEDRVIGIWTQCGRFLHDKTAFHDWPSPEESGHVLSKNLNALRVDHQWFWNLIWEHCTWFTAADVFFVRLGDTNQFSRPFLMKQEGHFEVRDFEFDPQYLADFDGEIDWDEYKP